MDTTEQSSFSSVLSANPYNNSYYISVSSFINQTNSPEFSKEQFAISYLNTNNFITAQIAISKNIPDEDLFDTITTKAYDDLGLDQAIEYSLQYIESFENLDENNRYFHVFLIDPLTLSQNFAATIEKINYIDTIIPAPLLLKSLYVKEIILSSGVHCFIYFQENDAFVTLYNNKEFLYTKSIKYSYKEMHERFCELYGERIEYSEFFKFLSKQNLKETNSPYKEFLIKLYKELFANINDILTYAKRAFEIDKFEQIYIGSQIDTITQLDEMIEAELNIKASEFNFNYGFETQEPFIDQLQYLMHLYTTLHVEERYKCNFTIYHRPPKFIQRESGKLIILIIISLILAFSYPITYWILTYAQGLQHDLLRDKYNALHITKTTREATLKNKTADKTKSLTLLKEEKNQYTTKKNTLLKIHDVKVNYPMKAKLIALISKDFRTFGVRLEAVSYKKNLFSFSLVADKDKNITRLIKYLTKVHDRKFKFSIQEISYDKKLKKYFSKLEVEILWK